MGDNCTHNYSGNVCKLSASLGGARRADEKLITLKIKSETNAYISRNTQPTLFEDWQQLPQFLANTVM